MQRPRIHVMRQAHLLDAAQALKPRVLNQVEQQTVRYADETIDGVVEDFGFAHDDKGRVEI